MSNVVLGLQQLHVTSPFSKASPCVPSWLIVLQQTRQWSHAVLSVSRAAQ